MKKKGKWNGSLSTCFTCISGSLHSCLDGLSYTKMAFVWPRRVFCLNWGCHRVPRVDNELSHTRPGSHKLCMSSFLPQVMSLPLVCRAHVRPGQKRTETRCGMPGAHGVNVPVPVEEEPHTPCDGASAPSKDFHLLSYIYAATYWGVYLFICSCIVMLMYSAIQYWWCGDAWKSLICEVHKQKMCMCTHLIRIYV